MPAHVHLSQDTYRTAMEAARPHMALVADKIAARAKASFAQELPSADIEVSRVDGVRPEGRPYAEVLASNAVGQEWGSSKTQRRRILGRSAEGFGSNK